MQCIRLRVAEHLDPHATSTLWFAVHSSRSLGTSAIVEGIAEDLNTLHCNHHIAVAVVSPVDHQ